MPALEASSLTKHFGGITALRDVGFAVEAGEVMALVGDNGAGKSTLIKIFAGAHAPDGGSLRIKGEPVNLRSPQEAWARGVATIFQELALAGKMNVADNIFLGRERRRRILGIPFLDRAGMREEAARLLSELEVEVPDPGIRVEYLSGGQRQGIAIARALNLDADIIIMDEPTAALAVAEVRKVLDFIQRLRGQGKAVILISHNVQDVFEVSDRITVMRQGQVEGLRVTSETSPEEVIGLITGAARVSHARQARRREATTPA